MLRKILTLCLLVVLSLGTLTACNGGEGGVEEQPGINAPLEGGEGGEGEAEGGEDGEGDD